MEAATEFDASSPFHEGERDVQARMGVRDSIEPWARQVVRNYLPEQHRDFYSSLPFLVAAARDTSGRPWATVLSGKPGFIDSPDKHRLSIRARVDPEDPLHATIATGAELGLLGIELETRRRNRVNGRVSGQDEVIVLDVIQTFGNCPQYIHPRAWRWEGAGEVRALRDSRLNNAQRRWIGAADTFFIASGYRGEGDAESFGMDASHRGGPRGFVQVHSDTRLVFPDYAGNNHFNTIGNLIADPRVGLLLVDFDTGSTLQITGRARIDWDSDAVAAHPGAQRLVIIEVEEVVELRNVLPLRWSQPEDVVRSLRLVSKVAESEDVTSFEFTSRDGGPLPDFEAGQHLPVHLDIPGHDEPVARTYSLSNGPGEDRYRITVKRETNGLASRFLHDVIETGDLINAEVPAGDFVLSPGDRPIVLISAGVGVTPMVSMLHELTQDPLKRPTWFIHGARDGKHHALKEEVAAISAEPVHVNVFVAYSRPGDGDTPGVDYDQTGRIDADLIESLLPGLGAEFYLCGPSAFLADLVSELRSKGVPEEALHTETFGPAA